MLHGCKEHVLWKLRYMTCERIFIQGNCWPKLDIKLVKIQSIPLTVDDLKLRNLTNYCYKSPRYCYMMSVPIIYSWFGYVINFWLMDDVCSNICKRFTDNIRTMTYIYINQTERCNQLINLFSNNRIHSPGHMVIELLQSLLQSCVNLPTLLRDIHDLNIFKRSLKTYLFEEAYQSLMV